MNIVIVGLGLMGGSFALDIKKFDFIKKIAGYDHNKKHEEEAIKLSLVENIVSKEEIVNFDVVILAIPVNAIIKSFKTLGNINKNTTIIDFGSTKEIIVKNIPKNIRKNFIASHPMTGTENFGPNAAFSGLYKDKTVVLCDLENSGEHQVRIAKKLFEALGMKQSFMSAKEHDKHAAFISHMPHIISYSIANSVMKQENKENILTLAAGGFRSMSRLAKSSPDMWEDIFRQNKFNLLEAIEIFEKELKKLTDSLNKEDWKSLRESLIKANSLHDILD